MTFDELQRKNWNGGQLLAFSALDGATDYGGALIARTSFGAPGLDIVLPASCRVRFPLPAGSANVVAGDWFRIGSGPEAIQGVFLDAYHLLIEGACELLNRDPAIASVTNGRRTLIGPADHFDAARVSTALDAALRDRGQWSDAIALPSKMPLPTRRTLLKALSIMKTQVCSAEGKIRHRWTTPDRWPHRNMWLWDSTFHAIGWRHLDAPLARDAIAAVLDMQAPDGFVAHTMTPFDTSTITQPPVLALGVKLVDEADPCEVWIEELYPKLCAYVEWDMTHRDSDGAGLAEWFIEGNPECRSGESGMDNSPRFDTATRMDAVDFNAFLAHECEILAGFASRLGLPADAEKWAARHANLCRLIAGRLWSPEHRFFMDYDVERQDLSPVLASAGFLPLICGAASQEQAQYLAGHLNDPAMFGTAFPVPSIAVKDGAHYAKDMWRGPVWININWLIAYGFDRYGMSDVASALREKTLRVIETACEEYGSIFEYYDDRAEVGPPQLLRKGACAPERSPFKQVIHDFGWSVTLYADMVYSAFTTP